MHNLRKSEEGWRRFRERTSNGANARRARMDHRVTPRIREEVAGEREIARVALAASVRLRGQRVIIAG